LVGHFGQSAFEHVPQRQFEPDEVVLDNRLTGEFCAQRGGGRVWKKNARKFFSENRFQAEKRFRRRPYELILRTWKEFHLIQIHALDVVGFFHVHRHVLVVAIHFVLY